jgi:uncharacterized protein (TIGR04141 family)
MDELDAMLIDRIKSGKLEQVWMAVPEIVPWERVGGFRFGLGRRWPEYHDIHLPEFIKTLDPASITKDILTHRQIHCIDQDGLEIFKWPAYHCIYGEIDHAGNTFLLSGGKW